VRASASRPGTSASVAHLKLFNLALQGGGAHGAFARGVLDRLLEEKRIALDDISATSAGAINATVLVSGLVAGGRQGAKRALAKLWRLIAHLCLLTPLQPSLADRLWGNHSLDASPAFMLFDPVIRPSSPYQFNPFNYRCGPGDVAAHYAKGPCPVSLESRSADASRRQHSKRIEKREELLPEEAFGYDA
jgi:NTE family protein